MKMADAFVPLSQGLQALIDEADAWVLDGGKWSAAWSGRHFYAVRGGKRRPRQLLHRLLMGAGAGEVVDHRNGNTLDNRRSNLRLCTRKQNAQNQRGRSDRRSIYKGIHRNAKGRWVAQCEHRHVGVFDTEEDAARAYDRAACGRFGEFARPNFEEG